MNIRFLVVIMAMTLSVSGCAGLQASAALPVVIKAEDLVGRGYERIGQVQVSRERFGGDVLSTDDFSWAGQALQEEARKIGADAILQPELTVSTQSFLLFPMAEVRGRATAIRFR